MNEDKMVSIDEVRAAMGPVLITPDEVAKAVYADTWRINLHEATVTEASIHMTRGRPSEAAPVVYAVHHATLAELSRQQHEFIKMVRDYYLNLHPQARKQADALLALWPTAEEVEGS